MSGRTLVVGWFSFELMGSTAGDLIAKDVVCDWLARAGLPAMVAVTAPTGPREVATANVVPEDYETVVFVCGPIGDGAPLNEFLDRFPHARKLALNVTLLQDRSEWNPFAGILERDSAAATNPDITFAAPRYATPVLGLILVGWQPEYYAQDHDLAERTFDQIVQARDVAVVRIDTRLDKNAYDLRSPGQIESVIGKMDAVLTTRLHGAVLALRRHVPPVVIDPIPGGAKVFRQMMRIGWPLAFHAGDLDVAAVAAALDYALTSAARALAAETVAAARREVERFEQEFRALLGRR